MSYLNPLRLHFAGRFQAAVSTVNNDRAHFDNSKFSPDFQKMQTAEEANGWWNPDGDAAWRLVSCAVTSVLAPSAISQADPVRVCMVADSDSRVCAKLVDLDPDNQGVSMIFGLHVRIVDIHGNTLLRGTYDPTAFMDIWTRVLGGGGDGAASAMYQSVLVDLKWGDVSNSPFLTKLKASSAEGLLSIKFNVDQFNDDFHSSDFTLGRIVGTIGPASVAEPRSFVCGRQLTATDTPGNQSFLKPQGLINFCVADIDQNRGKVLLDLGNALPTIAVPTKGLGSGRFLSLGPLTLKCADVVIGTIDPREYALDPAWYGRTAGIVEMPTARALTPDEIKTVLSNPLSLTGPGLKVQGIDTPAAAVEIASGEYVRADKFVFRMNPTAGEKDNQVTTNLHATKFGEPLAGQSIAVNYVDMGAGATTPLAISFPALTAPTDAVGVTTLTISASDPGNPRGFIDGQLCGLSLGLQGDVTAPLNPSNIISILVWTAFKADNPVTWYGSIQAIFQQYANLYPVMKRFFELEDYDQVCENVRLLAIALALDPEDPNSMPVTRDLSEAKRKSLIAWLNPSGGSKPLLGTLPPQFHARPYAAVGTGSRPLLGGKEAFYVRRAATRQNNPP